MSDGLFVPVAAHAMARTTRTFHLETSTILEQNRAGDEKRTEQQLNKT
jgi:hypothetical protein